MTYDDDTITWLTYAVLAFDAVLVMVYGNGGQSQPLLFPRTLCRGQRLLLTEAPRDKDHRRMGQSYRRTRRRGTRPATR